MKTFIKKIPSCSSCPNAVQIQKNGFYQVQCLVSGTVIYDETQVHYDQKLEEIVCPDEIPGNCPLPESDDEKQLENLIKKINNKITKILDTEGKSLKSLAITNSVSDTIKAYFKKQ